MVDLQSGPQSTAAGALPSLPGVLDELMALRQLMLEAPVEGSAAVPPDRQPSARNLEHYLAFRTVDLRPVQEALANLGLSSLGRAEANVLAAVTATERAARALAGTTPSEWTPQLQGAPAVGSGRQLLEGHADRLLGPAPPERRSRIMITLPTAAASDPDVAMSLVRAGMDLARINAAHDDLDEWRAMIRHVREASTALGRPVRILVDLAGPKVRTGPVPAPPPVVKLRPRRTGWGVPVEPGRAVLVAADEHACSRIGDLPAIPVHGLDLASLVPGSVIDVTDTRCARRQLFVEAIDGAQVTIATWRTVYLGTGSILGRGDREVGRIGQVDVGPGFLPVTAGDRVVLTTGLADATVVPGGVRIGCTPAELVQALQPGHRILIDDGRIAGVVESCDPGDATVLVGRPVGRATKLRSEKGINAPDTDLGLAALTSDDLRTLDGVAHLVDAVGLSFVGDAADVARLQEELRSRLASHVGIVLKIETLRAFHALPELLVQAMASDASGVMIARGDLAVEVGYERLAEVQEEILWLCEAAHLPVIWATEVLDSVAKRGSPTRAEISDAALGDRAECVMLNKGPHILEAVGLLDGICRRMDDHLAKKQALLRPLTAWR